jgi:6-phosphofructokinase 1
MSKRIAILTSGGDCAGLNAALRAMTRRAIIGYGWEVIGVHQGTHGLLETPVNVLPLSLGFFNVNTIRLGGTLLGTTNKGNPFAYPMEDGSKKDRSDEITRALKDLKIDALIGVGGDGSLDILRRLTKKGNIPFVGVPKTIDNDLGSTESSIGFNTAVEIATEALDRLQPTAASHDRVMILEVMGRDAGHIALSAGIAGGADIILIPEIPYNLNVIAERLRNITASEHNFSLVIVAEAVKTEDGRPLEIVDTKGRSRYGGIGHYLADRLQLLTGAETRYTVLGHVLRGSEPSANDRLLASALGVHAVDLVAEGKFDRMVAWQHREVVDVPLEEALKNNCRVDANGILVRTARGLGICLGDAV